jgi:HAD superfamily hydrolase (TIGR01509 family)
MVIKAVILDMDGTVVEFRYNAGKAKKDLKAFITLQGIPDDIFYDEEPLAINVDRVKKYLMEKGDLGKVAILKDGVEKITTKYEMAAARCTNVIDGAQGALLKLYDMGLKIAVYTNSGRKALMTVMNRFELESYFCLILSRDEVPRMKPHPDGIVKALEDLEVEPKETIFVGDSVIDMVAATKAGVHAVGVVSGLRGENELREAGAGHIIHSISDLPDFIRDFPGGKKKKGKA